MKKIPAVLIIIIISLFMVISVVHRPISYISNEIAQEDTFDLGSNAQITQELDIFHTDRNIQEICIKFEGCLEETDILSIVVSMGNKSETRNITKADINSDGWYKLAYNFDANEEKTVLTISGKDLKGNIGLCLSQDIDNLGELSVNEKICDYVLTTRIACTIKNSVWDSNYKWLIAIYVIVALFIVYKTIEKEDKISDKILFISAIVLNILGVYIFVPYLFRCPQIAENVLNFYYLTAKNSIWECLLMSDAGYLPLGQRLIAIIFIKILGLGTNSLYYMQATGIILDAVLAATICLRTYRNLGAKATRFAVSLMVVALFAHSTVSTYFNFIYLGYFFILLVLLGNIEELKKWQFILICCISMIICLSKGFYVVFLPFGIILLLLCIDVLKRREKVYILCLTIASGIQLLYAFLHGGISKWIVVKKNVYLIGISVGIFIGFILISFIFIIPRIKKIIKKSLFLQSVLKPGMIVILMIGSFLLTFIALHGNISFAFLMNWGNAWYIPCSLAFIVLLCFLSNDTSSLYQYVSCIILSCYCIVAFKYSFEKCSINYNCVDWNVYKESFAKTVVPVFKYDTRFGTMADNLILCYSNNQPADNYEYGAPYLFEKINIEETKDVTCEFNLPEPIADRFTSAIYLNYSGDIGNEELYLECLNDEGEVIGKIYQITPLSSKTIGFIFAEEMQEITSLNVKTKDGEQAFVENKIIVIQREQ